MSKAAMATAFFSLAATALFCYTLTPGVFWASATKSTQSTDFGATPRVETQIGLWRSCNVTYTAASDNATTECITFGKPSKQAAKDAVKDLRTGERDGAAAGVVLAGFFGLLTFCFAVCKLKCCTVLNSLITTILSLAAVGLWVTYKTSFIDDKPEYGNQKYKFDNGFWLACAAAALNVLAFVFSWYIKKKSDSYDYLA